MRKLLFVSILSLACIFANAQNELKEFAFPVNADGQEEFQEVVELTATKNKLFSNAQEWVAKTFGDYKSVIQFEDNANGKLILKGHSSIETIRRTPILSVGEKMRYIITIECKDNRYRYTIANIEIVQTIKILSSRGTESVVTHNSHYEALEQFNNGRASDINKRDSLQSINTDDLKRKQIKLIEEEIIEVNDDILRANSMIKTEENFIKEEYLNIESLITSLKAAMSKNDDF